MPSSDWRKISGRSSTSTAGRFLARDKARLNRFFSIPVRRMVLTIIVCAWPGVPHSGATSGHDMYSFDIPAQRADLALIAFAEQTDRTLVFSFDETRAKTANRLFGQYDTVEALELLLAGTGLSISMGDGGQLKVAEDVALTEESIMAKSKSTLGRARGNLLGRVAAAFAGAILGASAGANESAAETPRSERVIEEILVTAQKRTENVDDIPISINVVTGEVLAEVGIDNLRDLQQLKGSLLFRLTDSLELSITGHAVDNDSNTAIELTTVRVREDTPLLSDLYGVAGPDVERG